MQNVVLLVVVLVLLITMMTALAVTLRGTGIESVFERADARVMYYLR